MPKPRGSNRYSISSLNSSIAIDELAELKQLGLEDNGAFRVHMAVTDNTDALGYEVYVVRNNQGKIIGAVSYKPTVNKYSGNIYIPNIGVLKQYQGKGIGKLLMKQVAKYAATKDAGIELVPLSDSLKFYTKLGFQSTAQGRVLFPNAVKELANA